MRRLLTAIMAIACTLVLAFLSTPATAQPRVSEADVQPTAPQSASSQALVVVLDLSGSMRDDDGAGNNKLAVAKQSVEHLLRSVPATVPTGVWGYPTPGDDCGAGSFVVAPDSKLGLPISIATVDAMSAAGGTPTGAALQAAVDQMKARGYTGATVVLISDGESNCGSPPCPVAEALAGTDFELTVHAVGFQQSEAGRAELNCVAAATRGHYYDVEDGDELIDRMDELASSSLEVTLDYALTISSGSTMVINAVVANNTAQRIVDVRANLSFVSDGIGYILPAVIPPTISFGSLDPGQEVRRQWNVSGGTDLDAEHAKFRVAAWGKNTEATSASGSMTIRDVSADPPDDDLLMAVRVQDRKLVVMGDSYSSGEGTLFYEDLADPCHQSMRTYMAPKLSENAVNLVACSGAVTANLNISQHPKNKISAGYQPQLNQLREMSDVGAVMLTLGGNDIGFADIIKTCATSNCTKDTEWIDAIAESIGGLSRTLPAAYRQVWEAANPSSLVPSKRGYSPVIVLAYPQILHDQSRGGCHNWFNEEEVRFANNLVIALNAAMKKAVSEVRAEGFEVYFVPNTQNAVLPSNTTCVTGDDAKINGLILEGIGAAPESYHPKASGYAAVTSQIENWLLTAERVEPSNPNQGGVDKWKPSLRSSAGTPQKVDVGHAKAGHIVSGGEVELGSSGFAPFSSAVFMLHSEPVTLGAAQVDEHGNAQLRTQIPDFVPPGQHTLIVTGLDENGKFVRHETAVRVLSPTPLWVFAVYVFSSFFAIAGLVLFSISLVRKIRSRKGL